MFDRKQQVAVTQSAAQVEGRITDSIPGGGPMTSEVPKSISCAEFQAQLPDLIGAGDSAADHPHVRECALCRELLENLETIAEAARQLFPEVEPPDDLWDQIDSAIKEDEKGKGELAN
jgi:hypothetical protein